MESFQTQSAKIDQIAKALFAAKRKIGEVSKTADNPDFNSKYADYGAVWGACKDPLEEEGLLVLQNPVPSTKDGYLFLETKIIHVESEQWIASLAEIPLTKRDPQAFGSALTYGRRYVLCTVLGIVTKDDDGNDASGRSPQQPHAPQAPPQQRQQRQPQPQSSGQPQGQGGQRPQPQQAPQQPQRPPQGQQGQPQPQGPPFQKQVEGLPSLPPNLGGGSVTFLEFPGADGKKYVKATGKVSDYYSVLQQLGFRKADNNIWWRRAA